MSCDSIKYYDLQRNTREVMGVGHLAPSPGTLHSTPIPRYKLDKTGLKFHPKFWKVLGPKYFRDFVTWLLFLEKSLCPDNPSQFTVNCCYKKWKKTSKMKINFFLRKIIDVCKPYFDYIITSTTTNSSHSMRTNRTFMNSLNC